MSSSQSASGYRWEVQEVAGALTHLHRALLDEQRTEYERAHGPVAPAQLLNLALHDPSFAWLRVLSEFMTDVDALLEEADPPSELEASALRWELEEVLSAAAERGFWDRCQPLLQVPAVAMAYGRLRSVLTRLPPPPPAGGGEEARANHRWAIARAGRRAP
jgi:hypothetical protein